MISTLNTTVHVAGEPTPGKADVHVGDQDELTDVRWVSPDEADSTFAPFDGTYPLVHEHLRKALGKE